MGIEQFGKFHVRVFKNLNSLRCLEEPDLSVRTVMSNVILKIQECRQMKDPYRRFQSISAIWR